MAETNPTYPPSIALRALEIARAKIGERETAKNSGPIVEWSLKGLTTRAPGSWSKWCAYFAWQCFLRSAQTPAQEQQIKSLASGSCTDSWRRLSTAGWTYRAPFVPSPGQIVFFSREDKRLYHCGLVERAESEQLFAIEGNSGDRVAANTYPLTHPSIFGFAEVRV